MRIVRAPSSFLQALHLRGITTITKEASQSTHEMTEKERQAETEAQIVQSKQTSSKTAAQADEELRRAMAGLSGDGGDAGIEYENGEPVAMKRSVKNNMFRYI